MKDDRAEERALLRVDDTLCCTIVQRLNRFVVEVLLAGKRVRAYINNTGRLEGFLEAGRLGFCFRFPHPKRTEVRLFALEEAGLGAVIDTRLQMRAFEQAIGRGLIPWLRGCQVVRRNPRLGESVLDYLLQCGGAPLFVEVKSAVLRDGDAAMYPDCPTPRGRRHIGELIRHTRDGGRGAIVFLAALPGVSAFRPWARGDPEVPDLLRRAEGAGVMIRSCSMVFDPADSWFYLDDADLDVRLE